MHEALDQIGAFAGPLLVAGVAAVAGGYRPGFAALVVPGVGVLALLAWLARAVPDPGAYERRSQVVDPGRLPGRFWAYAGFTALTMTGYATFSLLGYHLAVRHLVPAAAIPLVYALAMAVDALAALAVGPLYDRYGLRVLAVQPVLAALVPLLGFGSSVPAVLAGAVAWGAAMGLQESIMRAAVADLVPAHRRGTGYGVFGAVYGLAWFAGATAMGGLYEWSLRGTVLVVAAVQVVALTVLLVTGKRRAGVREEAPV